MRVNLPPHADFGRILAIQASVLCPCHPPGKVYTSVWQSTIPPTMPKSSRKRKGALLAIHNSAKNLTDDVSRVAKDVRSHRYGKAVVDGVDTIADAVVDVVKIGTKTVERAVDRVEGALGMIETSANMRRRSRRDDASAKGIPVMHPGPRGRKRVNVILDGLAKAPKGRRRWTPKKYRNQGPPVAQKQKEIKSAFGLARSTRKRSGNGQKGVFPLSGRDYLGVLAATGTSVGKVLFSQDLSPSAFVASRLAVLSEVFENYTVRSMVLTYEPSVAATTAGQLMVLCDTDASDRPPLGSASSYTAEFAHSSARTRKAWETNTAVLPGIGAGVLRWTHDLVGADPRLQSPGWYGVIQGPGCPNNTVLGAVYIEYVVEFSNPSIDIPGFFDQVNYSRAVTPASATAYILAGNSQNYRSLYGGTMDVHFGSNGYGQGTANNIVFHGMNIGDVIVINTISIGTTCVIGSLSCPTSQSASGAATFTDNVIVNAAATERIGSHTVVITALSDLGHFCVQFSGYTNATLTTADLEISIYRYQSMESRLSMRKKGIVFTPAERDVDDEKTGMPFEMIAVSPLSRPLSAPSVTPLRSRYF
jgi:hypothetical protein